MMLLSTPFHRYRHVGWQAKAPAPLASESSGAKVGQTLSSVTPAIRLLAGNHAAGVSPSPGLFGSVSFPFTTRTPR